MSAEFLGLQIDCKDQTKAKSAGQTVPKTAWWPGFKLNSDIPAGIRQELEKRLKLGDMAVLSTLGQMESPVVAGVRECKASDSLQWRRCFGSLAAALAANDEVAWSWQKGSNENLLWALLGFQQGSYQFDRYLKNKKPRVKKLTLHGLSAAQKKVVNEARIIGEAVHLCRDLVNLPAEDMGPDEFVAAAKIACKGTKLSLRVMDQAECQKAKMGALIAVGRASHRSPRLLIIDYKGSAGAKSAPFLALCGKGVCFDTGGLDIKTAQSMALMRKDMGGAATVLAAVVAHARLGGKTPLRTYIPLVENALGPNAFRPGDILTVSDGTTVEIGNTDAEGRLVLADALAQAKRDGAAAIVSVATLTGAAMVALGRVHVPIMGDTWLTQALEKGARATGEKVWRLPLDEDYFRLIKGQWADLTNSDGSGEAGCITAGAFLQHFAGGVPFAHCDISPASFKSSAHELGPAGATGVLVSSLVAAFRDFRLKRTK